MLTLQMSLIFATLHTMSQTSGHIASRSCCSVSMLLSSALCSRAAATQLSLASRSARILATSPLRTCKGVRSPDMAHCSNQFQAHIP